MTKSFNGNFTQQEPLSEAAIAAAVKVLESGRLHRYNLVAGEAGEVSCLEAEFAAWQGARYCLALTSGGQALQAALRAIGIRPGDTVLTNAFTLAPVPGAIEAVGAKSRLVEITENLRLDLADFEAKAAEGTARALLLSHMRGHLSDMDRVMEIARRHGLKVIEDCAHTMGATWNGTLSGNFGDVGCFSAQTYKHINSGEGGFLTTADPYVAARATILSGSYMLHARHGAGPSEEHFRKARLEMPNTSCRMDALRAAILRVQLPELNRNIARWNARHDRVREVLERAPGVALPAVPDAERRVGSSIQFRTPGLDGDGCLRLIGRAAERGVELKWFGREEPVGFTSAHGSWGYVEPQSVPRTDAVLATLFDMRIPLTFSEADCTLIGEIIVDALREVTENVLAGQLG